MTDPRNHELVVVGAGAAGLWAAWVAALRGAEVLLLEKTPRTGTKILASGGTRCNLTTTLDAERAGLGRGLHGLWLPAGRRARLWRPCPPRASGRRFSLSFRSRSLRLLLRRAASSSRRASCQRRAAGSPRTSKASVTRRNGADEGTRAAEAVVRLGAGGSTAAVRSWIQNMVPM